MPRRFSHSRIACATTGEHCSCGFLFDDSSDLDAHESRRSLAAYLRAALDRGALIELFASWCGDEDNEPVARVVLVPEDLLGADPSFEDCFDGTPLFCNVVSRRS